MRPSAHWLPTWPWLVLSSTAVDHRMTSRVLHTDCHEVFSVDHRLTFRGLPAEGLRARAHEATFHLTTLACASGAPRSGRQEGLCSASGTFSNGGGAARGAASSCLAALPGRSAAANGSAPANPCRVFLAVHRRTILVRPSEPVSIGECCQLGPHQSWRQFSPPRAWARVRGLHATYNSIYSPGFRPFLLRSPITSTS